MPEAWTKISEERLQQCDLLDRCLIPIVSPNFSLTDEDAEIEVETRRLIVATQSCDLENKKAPYVALCPIHTLDELKDTDPKYENSSRLENIRKGRTEGLYMLVSPDDPDNNQRSLVVDFRMIVSLPIGYLENHALALGERYRLQSPFVEHFSQTFARFFMRVGLPSQIQKFK